MSEPKYPRTTQSNLIYGAAAVVIALVCIFLKAGLRSWVLWVGIGLVLLGLISVGLGIYRSRQRS